MQRRTTQKPNLSRTHTHNRHHINFNAGNNNKHKWQLGLVGSPKPLFCESAVFAEQAHSNHLVELAES